MEAASCVTEFLAEAMNVMEISIVVHHNINLDEMPHFSSTMLSH
jgi:hypothetical protein